MSYQRKVSGLTKSSQRRRSRRRPILVESLESRCLLTTTPIAYWSFDAAGSLGQDSSGSGSNLTLFGDAAFTASGKTGGALSLDGAGDYLGGTPAVLPTRTAPYSMAAWIRPDVTGTRAIVGWGSFPTALQSNTFGLFGDNGLRNDWGVGNLRATDAQVAAAGVNLDDGNWHHVAVSYTGTSRSLYVDGQRVAQGNTPLHNDTNVNFRVGSSNPTGSGEYFDGLLDDVAIWDIPLDANQIAALFNGTSPMALREAGLVGQWTANDLVGTVADGAVATTWTDSVSNVSITGNGGPRLETNEINGHAVIRFDPSNGNDQFRLLAANNPLSGTSEFSVAVVFRPAGAGVGTETSQWSQATGLIDASQLGVTNDWGLSLNANGQVGAGLGSPDVTQYSPNGANFANGQTHVALYTRAANTIRLNMDGSIVTSRSDGSTALRGISDLVFGSLQTNQNYFQGDIAEILLYNKALSIAEGNTLVESLVEKYEITPPAVPVQIAGDLLVDLKATDPSAATQTWINTGSLGDFARIGNPTLQTIDGVTAVAFNFDNPSTGWDDAYQGPPAPVNVVDDGLRTIEVWAYNPNDGLQNDEETMVAWGRRGGPDSSNLTFGYGRNSTWGAVGHWGADDMPWTSTGGSPPLGQWHHLVYTYDGGTTRLYSDGVLTYSEAVGILATHTGTTINLAVQNGTGGAPSFAEGQAGSLAIANVRIHSGVLSPEAVASNFAAGIQIAGDPPVVVNDAYGTNEDTTLTIPARGVLANDTDPNGLALTAILDTSPEHGTLTLNLDGSFTYVPDSNYHGTDSFTYKAQNADVVSLAATVNLTINSVRDPAVAVADNYVVDVNSAFTLTSANGILSNDTNVDGLSLSAVLVSNTTAGQLVLQPNGALTYNPQGIKGPQRFTYRINDGAALSNTVTVTLLVDTPPVPDHDTYTVAEDGLLTIPAATGLLQGDVDAEGDALTARLVANTQHGTLTLQPNGSFTYEPHDNFFGVDTFTYQANDGDQDSAVATVSLTVTPVNDPPVAITDSYFGFQNQQLIRGPVQGVLSNDLDVDGPSLSAILVDQPGTGTLTFQPDGSFVYVPIPGFIGSTSFTYKATDSLLQSQTVTVNIIVNSPDQQIVINEIHFNPAENTEKSEFIELYNAGTSLVDLSNWFFSSGVSYVIPAGTQMAPGQFLVIAQDPATMQSVFETASLGPWTGALDSDGEEVVLRSGVGDIVDRVDYNVAFPWPTATAGEGNSMELINPNLDNDLGGSWRSSVIDSPPLPTDPVIFIPEFVEARYFVPTTDTLGNSWTTTSFDATSWSIGQTGIGYETAPADYQTLLRTQVRPNQANASATSIFMRIPFAVDDLAAVTALQLRMKYDDGFVAYINGVEVARRNVTPPQPSWNTLAADHPDTVAVVFEDIEILNPMALLNQGGNNVLAIHGINASAGSSDMLILPELRIPSEAAGVAVPTPGEVNSVFATNAPPQSRQADHSPKQPTANESAVITIKVTDPDGVANVNLQYQIVLPGQYVPAYLPVPLATLLSDAETPREPNPDYFGAANWTTLPMVDDGTGSDRVAGDGVFTAVIPGQAHRTLVRYRMRVEDVLGMSVQVPYADDPSLNFAYFVYNGVPDYQTTTGTFTSDVLEELPVYHVITRNQDMSQVLGYNAADQIAQGPEARFVYNWSATFVYDGEVYDNIKYRLRGANGRYHAAGKRSMRFRFNQGNFFQGADQDGNDYPVKWETLTTGKGFDNRLTLTQGLNEALTLRLSNELGVPASNTLWAHFRVIDGAAEAPDQWRGDFWGLNFIVETYDVQFLESHDLEKGNLYKLINSRSTAESQQSYQATDAVGNGADHDNIEINLTGDKTADYIDAHVNLEKYYLYRSLVEAVRHYDYWPDANKNMVYYFEPDYQQANNGLGKLWILPWDTDASWGPTWNEGHDVVYNSIFASGGGGGDPNTTPELWPAYFNAIREMRDLMWQPDQINPLIDEYAAIIASFEVADRARWQNAPADAGNYNGIAGAGATSLAALVQDMKNFAFVGGNWPGGSVGPGGRAAFLDQLQASNGEGAQLPDTPSISYIGGLDFPSNDLTFQTTSFSDPQGAATFGAMEWRVAEITDPNAPAYDPNSKLLLEWNATWESSELTTFGNTIDVPAGLVQPGHTYRARVRMKDATGRWSHWSAPLEFTATIPDNNGLLREHFRITEISYDPIGPTSAEIVAGFDQSDDFEFIEFVNTSATSTLDLNGATLSNGVSFAFSAGTVRSLAPGARVVVVEDLDAFRLRYGNGPLVAGEWTGGLSGNGETLALADANAESILSFAYSNNGNWSTRANGNGSTLQVIDTAGDYANGNNWQASARINGDPGSVSATAITGVVINEILAHTDPPMVDAIELHNTTAGVIDIGGWFLSDSNGDIDAFAKFRVPTGTRIQPGGYVVFDETDFNATMGLNPNDFALNSFGDEVWLTAGTGGLPLYFVDGVEFGGTRTNTSLGRVPSGSGQFAPQHRMSLGCQNGNPSLGPIIISEIMYQPTEPSVAELAVNPNLSASELEYIELYNSSANSVDLSGWTLEGGATFTFPTGTSIAAGATLVVLPFNPNGSVNVPSFNARYGVSVTGNPRYIGGYTGRMNDEGESVQLRQPQTDPLGIYTVLIDEVVYDDGAGWPDATGTGNALHRSGTTVYGSLASHWGARVPSVGTVAFGAGVLGDLTGDGQVTDDDIDLVFDEVRRGSTVRANDLNNNGTVTVADAQFLITNVLQSLIGDANLDRVVDGSDFNLWNQSKFSDCGVSWGTGDFNGDAVVDGSDLNLWFTNRFRQASAPAATSRSVPRAAGANVAVVLPAIEPPVVRSVAALRTTDTVLGTIRAEELRGAGLMPSNRVPPNARMREATMARRNDRPTVIRSGSMSTPSIDDVDSLFAELDSLS